MNAAGLGSNQLSAPQPNFELPTCTNQQQTEYRERNYRQNGSDNWQGWRNEITQQTGEEETMFSRFFPWPNISVCKKFEHVHSKAQW